MTRFSKFLLAAALGGTALTGAAYAAQDQTAAPSPTGMHHHHRGHGDRLARLDTNKDGIITRDEAIAAATAHFDKFDANHDGKIDQSEIAAAKQRMEARRQDMRAKWQARRAAKTPAAPTDQPAPADQ
jgi:hypothetical protein